jgi:pyruvate/2-oxoglutarate dehydrogenase complex dihydrolipoamide acyltransferase (E2) component
MIEVLVPRENVNDESVIIRAIHAKSGEQIRKGQLIVQVETSKTNIDIEAPEDGTISHNLLIGAEIRIGERLFYVGDKNIQAAKNEQLQEIGQNIKISKAAALRAKELGVDLSQLQTGWITSESVEINAGLKKTEVKRMTVPDYQPNESITLQVSSIKEPITKRKQVEVKNLQAGQHQSTSSTIGIDIKVPGKRVIEPPYLFQGSISDLIVYEGSRLLRKYPKLNAAYINPTTLGVYDEINFGWSFDNGSNLKVLAIKDTDKLSLNEIQNEVNRLLDLYESNKNIPMDILSSSTVTISDLSRTNASFIFPLINGLQSMILGIVKRSENNFSIYATFDHRVSEGLTVTNFLTELKSRILSYYLDNNGIAPISCYVCEKSMAEEISLRHRGFIKITLPNGEDTNLCRNCFDGW